MMNDEQNPSRSESRVLRLVATLGFALLLGLLTSSGAPAKTEARAAVPAEITLPDDFRSRFTHLGSWFVPEGGASGFHDVYADGAAVAGYRAKGRFPDGAVLVKELRAHEAGTYTTGAGVAHAIVGQAGVKQWFVMVKDATDRHAGSSQWGDGWGWGLFKADDPTTNVVTDYRADCLGCHVPAKANDWVYVEAYPTLGAK